MGRTGGQDSLELAGGVVREAFANLDWGEKLGRAPCEQRGHIFSRAFVAGEEQGDLSALGARHDA